MTSYYQKNREKIKQQRRERYANDAAYREKQQENSKQWRLNNPERMQEHRKTWEHSNPSWIMYHNANRRAKELGLPFNISFKDIVIPEYCPILGIRLSNDTRESTASLDRVKPELGYVIGNVRVISMRANRLKQDASLDELRAIVKYMEDNQ